MSGVKGAIRTRVGYTGGKKENPTYYQLGDHTETVEIDFDPRVTSYAQLLDIFWQSHSATTALPRQYMSAIWYHNDTQKQLANQTKEQQQQMKKRQLVTLIAPAQRFYLAEDYHQKYYLQGERVLFNVLKLDPHDAHAIANSRVATRLNAFVGGYTTLENLEAEFDSFELPDSTKNELRNLLGLQRHQPKLCHT